MAKIDRLDIKMTLKRKLHFWLIRKVIGKKVAVIKNVNLTTVWNNGYTVDGSAIDGLFMDAVDFNISYHLTLKLANRHPG